jgi:hypothetical protein
MADHVFMLKGFSSNPVPKMTNEDHKNISVRIATLWAKFFNLRHLLITMNSKIMFYS